MATWQELAERFGHTERRRHLLGGMLVALQLLRVAGCKRAYIDGSFTTTKPEPGDYDGCWDMEGVDFDVLDPRLLDFSNRRAAQKAAFLGEMFLADSQAEPLGTLFRDFFQRDREGRPKGIVVLDLGGLP